MKRNVLICCLFFILITVLSVFAQDEEVFVNPTFTDKFIEQQERMLENLDTLFPRTLLKETYDYASAPDVHQLDGFSFSSQNKAGRRELTITVFKINNDESYSQGWDLFPTTGSYENFYLHIDIQLIDEDESNKGYCWFEYTNRMIVGEDKRISGGIDFPYEVFTNVRKPSGNVYTKQYDLYNFEHDYEPHTLEMIRLNGYTSVFIDRHFIVGFEDGFSGKFSHMYGVGIGRGGEYATYAFDNFIIRRQ